MVNEFALRPKVILVRAAVLPAISSLTSTLAPTKYLLEKTDTSQRL
jgi:hypothetical protein